MQHSVDLLEKAEMLVIKLNKDEAVDWKVLTAAIYLHDIFAEDSESHGQQAADFIEQNFRENDIFTDEQIEKIKQAVAFHDKKIPEDTANVLHDLNLETKILYDVDNIDAFGIKGIYRYLSAHISRGLAKQRSAEQVLAHIKQKVAYNVEQRRNNLYFEQSRQLADAEFPTTKMFFDKLVEEPYPVGSKKGATGVFTFIWENFQDIPGDIAEKAIRSLEQEGQGENFPIERDFTDNYFRQLIQVYEEEDKQVNTMPKYSDFGQCVDINELFSLIEQAI